MPQNYFPQQYLGDLGTFCQGHSVPPHGPFWMLCGMTMGNLFEPQNRELFTNPADFLCCLYGLNRINEVIYNHFCHLHAYWCSKSAPFVDCTGCDHYHGGWLGNPDSILQFAQDPSYIPRARPVKIPEDRLQDFTQFFFFEYLPSIFSKDICVQIQWN
jgi:hypothetical protein